jgi:hypothetical protein
MKFFLIKVSVCLILFSCKSLKSNTYNKRLKEAFIYDFKMTYFKKLLIEGFNRTDAIRSIVWGDNSGFAEIILSPDDYHMLDSIVKIDNDAMIKDSLDGFNRAEGAQGKRVFAYALIKFESKWLDSLAKARSKIFMADAKSN